ncbi:MAG: tetratricopeptide repeat protein [Bacteroidetes bacterium]|nr:tetratricopeptide repeat protein [Bacteroidota bacterium]
MKNYVSFILILLLYTWLPLQAQLTKDEMKVYKKCEKLYKKKKYNDAAEKFEPVVLKHQTSCNVWGALLKYRQADFYNSKSLFGSGFTIKVTGQDSDKLAGIFTAEFMENLMNPGRGKYLGALKSSILKCENDRNAQIYLRILTVDKWFNPDTAIHSEAKEFCNQAENFFAQGNYDESIKYFKKALAKEPNYMQAIVHLGDCYYMQKRYDKSADYFKSASDKWPHLLEPKKFLTDALLQKGELDDAREVAMSGIMCYPDDDMFQRFAEASKENSGKFNRRWMERWAPISSYKVNYFYVNEPATGDWAVYANAKNDIREFCDTTTGIIIKENAITKAGYLEVYAWEKMLKTASGEEFAFAKKMQKLGYLDCYVFLSLFQVDLYRQQQDFVSKNKQKVEEYLELLMKEK